ncbi:MAG: lytic murein transglycosylase [Gemmatimonadaceae bacterium]
MYRGAFLMRVGALLRGIACLSIPVPAALRADDFDRCMAKLKATRAARAITAATWTEHVSDLRPNTRVVESLNTQPEFKLHPWDYLAIMADDQRVNAGRGLLLTHKAMLDRIGKRFDVDPAVLIAIWGIESNYGEGRGGLPVLRSLATLSCEGRRQTYFRTEFLAALRIVQAGHIESDRFRGSWAGAFGHVQFMPGTFEWLAVDYDGDGRRDIMDNEGDALASAANFLRKAGRWRVGQPWGLEVKLLAGFSTTGEGRRVKRTLDTWKRRGVTRVDGTPLTSGALSDTVQAGLVTPSGPTGPAFLVLRNFDAIHRYNAAEIYALAILHLSDRLKGGGHFATAWPTNDPGLSRADRRELQSLLAERGYDVGAPTPALTSAIVTAIKAEQRRLGEEPSGRPGQRLLATLRAALDRSPAREEPGHIRASAIREREGARGIRR